MLRATDKITALYCRLSVEDTKDEKKNLSLIHICIVLKLLLLPVVMGVGYEIIKFCGRHDNVVTRAVSAPGLWLQHITTNGPDDSMIECAIAAVLPVLPEDPDEGKW